MPIPPPSTISRSPSTSSLQHTAPPTGGTGIPDVMPMINRTAVPGMPDGRSKSPAGKAAPRATINVRPLGGMGPAAGVEGARDLLDQSTRLYEKENVRVNVVVVQATDVPDRTAALLHGGKDPTKAMAKAMARTARGLKEGETAVQGFYCNTANKFLSALQGIAQSKGMPINHVHIADATLRLAAAEAEKADLPKGSTILIGLLATSGTIDLKIYHERAEALSEELGYKIEFRVPNAVAQEHEVMEGIYKGVKGGDMAKGERLLQKAARELQAENDTHVLLAACTEIPMVLKTGDVQNGAGDNTPIIDTLKAMNTGLIDDAMARVNGGGGDVHTGKTTRGPRDDFATRTKDFLRGAHRMAGFIGGTDPGSAVRLADLTVKLNTGAKKDQEHAQAILHYVAGLPTDPALQLGELKDAMERMSDMGAHDISLATLADHAHFEALAEFIKSNKLGLRFHNAIDESFKQLPPDAKRVGLLGTDSAQLQGLFAERAKKTGRTFEFAASGEDAAQLAGPDDLAAAITRMKEEQHVDAVILTSPNLADMTPPEGGHAIKTIDPQAALAGTAITRSKMRVNVAARAVRQAIA